MNWGLLILMFLGHFLADYTLQGWLANGKQKSWWEENVTAFEKSMYRYDYLTALACHSFYWSIIVCLPGFFSEWFAFAVIINTVIHSIVDHAKANLHLINLTHDQAIHAIQIIITAYTIL